MSQCITFCPEQTDWKAIVHDRAEPAITEADEAAKLFLHEDGFETGLLYREPRATWPPAGSGAGHDADVAALSDGFRV